MGAESRRIKRGAVEIVRAGLTTQWKLFRNLDL